MRTFSGKVLLRLPANIHKELAQEAFKTGRSLNQLCLIAILARRVLKTYDPWKSIEKLWDANQKVDPEKLSRDIRSALADVRRGPKD